MAKKNKTATATFNELLEKTKEHVQLCQDALDKLPAEAWRWGTLASVYSILSSLEIQHG